MNTATRSPGLNLAVHRDHVETLLAQPAPEAPLVLTSFEPGARIADVTVIEGEALPTTRMQIEQVMAVIGQKVGRCIDTLDDPSPSLRLQVPPLSVNSGVGVSSNLSHQAEGCIRDGLSFTGMLLPGLLAQTGAGDSPIVLQTQLVDISHTDANGASQTNGVVALRLEIGVEPEAGTVAEPNLEDIGRGVIHKMLEQFAEEFAEQE